MKMTKLDRASSYVFLAVVFLLPFFFLPFTQFSLSVGKGLLLSIGIITSFTLWLVARFVEGRIILPKSNILLTGLGVLVTFLLSAIFSPSMYTSLMGGGFEVGTFGSVLLAFLAMFLGANFTKDKKTSFNIYLALSFSFIITALVFFVNIVAGPSSSLAKILPINLLGSWNDLAVFSGLIAILSILALEFSSFSKHLKILSKSLLVVSLFFLAVFNFLSTWVVVGGVALFIFIFKFMSKRISKEGDKAIFPNLSFVVVIISLIFVIANSLIGGFLSNKLRIDNTEVRPSVGATYTVARESLMKEPLFGVGLNRFSTAWAKSKPEAVNLTAFWDTNFNTGSGLVPTFAVTTGLLGFISLLIFFIFFLIRGYKAINQKASMDFGSGALFISALFLWIFAVIYTPNVVIWILSFILTGAFIGSQVAEKQIKNFDFSFVKDPRLSFFSILVLVGLIGGSLGLGYAFVKRFAGAVHFQKSALSPNTLEGLTSAENHLAKALTLDANNDLYYRSLSQIYTIQLNYLLNQQNANPEELKAKVQTALSNAEAAAKIATEKNPTNFINWLSLASVYEQILPIGVKGSYENAKGSIDQALILSPKNPGLYLRLARLEALNKNTAGARANVEKSLKLKSNYPDAVIMLSQLDATAGDYDKAISMIENLASFYPNDKDLANYLTELKTHQGTPEETPATE